jgi:hypothetical protein
MAIVAVAPDLDATSPVSMLLEELLPAIEHRFRPHRAFAISGISRGAGQALDTAVATPWRFESLGLHSPAVSASVEIGRSPAAVMIDAHLRRSLDHLALARVVLHKAPRNEGPSEAGLSRIPRPARMVTHLASDVRSARVAR